MYKYIYVITLTIGSQIAQPTGAAPVNYESVSYATAYSAPAPVQASNVSYATAYTAPQASYGICWVLPILVTFA